MKLKEYRKKLEEMTDQELESTCRNSRQELFHLKFQRSAGHLDDFTKIRQIRKNIARIETILSERKQGTFWTKRGLTPSAQTAQTRKKP